ncbi:MAG: thiazole synthase [Cycloclasticus sp. symbiont of Poecilosclerida sp. M]|nr:MAG: thiazole synthase [Cycloclasticus sp. symbiont of Poecilosclerida sp. M]
MIIQLNGEAHSCHDSLSLAQLVAQLGFTGKRLAVELNEEIRPSDSYSLIKLKDGDHVEIVQAIGGGQAEKNPHKEQNNSLIIAGKSYSSRLLVGTGKYKDLAETQAAIECSGAEIVTVAIRRTNIGQNVDEPNLLDVIPPEKYTILPNTAGCYTAQEALRTCRLARELLGGHSLVKLEVLGDEKTLFPDITATLEATDVLVKEGFDVMVYTNDDPVIAKRLEEMGCVAVMPLAAPIGSGLGIRNPYNILTIIENANVPIIVDAGVGTASDAAVGMELGCEGILMNTAIAHAKDPVLMASAMKKAVQAGREAYLAGRMPRRRYASASSPIDGLI